MHTGRTRGLTALMLVALCILIASPAQAQSAPQPAPLRLVLLEPEDDAERAAVASTRQVLERSPSLELIDPSALIMQGQSLGIDPLAWRSRAALRDRASDVARAMQAVRAEALFVLTVDRDARRLTLLVVDPLGRTDALIHQRLGEDGMLGPARAKYLLRAAFDEVVPDVLAWRDAQRERRRLERLGSQREEVARSRVLAPVRRLDDTRPFALLTDDSDEPSHPVALLPIDTSADFGPSELELPTVRVDLLEFFPSSSPDDDLLLDVAELDLLPANPIRSADRYPSLLNVEVPGVKRRLPGRR